MPISVISVASAAAAVPAEEGRMHLLGRLLHQVASAAVRGEDEHLLVIWGKMDAKGQIHRRECLLIPNFESGTFKKMRFFVGVFWVFCLARVAKCECRISQRAKRTHK